MDVPLWLKSQYVSSRAVEVTSRIWPCFRQKVTGLSLRESVRKKRYKMPQDGSILTWVNINVWCI